MPCIRLRAEHENHIWTYDFVQDNLENGTKFRILNIIDEYTRKCIACIPRTSFTGYSVVEILINAFKTHGVPEYIRSDNGKEFVANKVKDI